MDEEKIVDFKNVAIRLNNKTNLRDITFSIRKGEFVYIYGKPGCGKNSLLQTIYGQRPLKGGSAIIDNISIKKSKTHTLPYLRRKSGIIHQKFPLIKQFTTEENLDYILRATDWRDPKSRERRIAEVLEVQGIKHLKQKQSRELSKKEYLQVQICRAILNSPPILIIDLSAEEYREKLLKEILTFIRAYSNRNKTTVLFAISSKKIPEYFPDFRILECKNNTVVEITKKKKVN
jgi:cell division transport system ATP-binding protein